MASPSMDTSSEPGGIEPCAGEEASLDASRTAGLLEVKEVVGTASSLRPSGVREKTTGTTRR